MNRLRESAPDAPVGGATDHTSHSWWTGRSEIFVGLLVIGVGLFLTSQTLAMHVPDTSTGPGPQLFPGLVSGLMVVLGGLLVFQVVRTPAAPAEEQAQEQEQTDETASAGVVGELVEGQEPRRTATHSDWRTVGLVLASVVAFAVLLQPLGWLLSGALLFFGVSWAFGGRRPLFEAAVALVYSAVVQLAFVAGLGLNLPSGILGGVL
ncbi:tripartite tricarboxylate transporter TctB family protein [Nocardiopsis sp. MG754419]|uniref:tripartite tricarboxylate transporter TctB family protein n=1 Tax=Nocardiopsis sp. MG754419 TaxID=2259865 RepID=UPI001BA7556F|nr:tripartite tricarboxylate transporter TctB family protein [Nocardiopsis sp. MG754419]MBR8742369.1 tripartite tricarboxylate transporter TctB family protein [Nocardiopsis sp. MG754419]